LIFPKDPNNSNEFKANKLNFISFVPCRFKLRIKEKFEENFFSFRFVGLTYVFKVGFVLKCLSKNLAFIEVSSKNLFLIQISGFQRAMKKVLLKKFNTILQT